jgi:hypothetical protein
VRSATVAEAMLRRLMPRDEAAAIAGDLLEASARHGRIWFWTSVASTAIAFSWRNLLTGRGRAAPTAPSFETEGALMTDSRSLARTLWHHKWLLVAPALLAVAATSVWSYSRPPRYRSEVTLLTVPPGGGFGDLTVRTPDGWSREQFEPTLHRIKSHARLRNLIEEFDLYRQEREAMIVEDVIARMRDDISVTLYESTNRRGCGR